MSEPVRKSQIRIYVLELPKEGATPGEIERRISKFMELAEPTRIISVVYLQDIGALLIIYEK